MIKIKDLIQEDIYGRMATVFHRTSISDLVNKVFTDGFKIGYGNIYGKGFYSTYDLESQLNDKMKDSYGNVIVKFQVTIDNFLIFDYSEFIKSPLGRTLKYTEDDFILKQLDHFKLDYNVEDLTRDIRIYKTKSYHIAAACLINIKNLIFKIDGMIFSGNRDGNVLVCYRPDKLIIPMSFTLDEGKTWTKTEPNLNYFKKVFTNRNSDNSKLSVFGIKELRDGLTLETIQSKYKWLLDADFEDAILYENDGVLVWESGTWKDGKWEGGIWYDGTWYDGTWERGTWKGGTWKDGVWGKGTWMDGEWNDGTWFGGEWESGTWNGGKWLGGQWNGGTWERGVWEDGVWEDGYWWDGTWFKGIWNGGKWEGGTWKHGKWFGGTWRTGTWEGGTWKDKKSIAPNKR